MGEGDFSPEEKKTTQQVKIEGGRVFRKAALAGLTAVGLATGVPAGENALASEQIPGLTTDSAGESNALEAFNKRGGNHDYSQPFMLKEPRKFSGEIDPALRSKMYPLFYSAEKGDDPERNTAIEQLTAVYGPDSWRKFLSLLEDISPTKGKQTWEQIAHRRFVGDIERDEDPEKQRETLYAIADILRAENFDQIRKVVDQLRELGYKKDLPIEELTPAYIDVLENPEQQRALIAVENLGRKAANDVVNAGLIEDKYEFYKLPPLMRLNLYLRTLAKEASEHSPK